MIFTLLWFGSGILGTICALLAWKKLIGYVTYGRFIGQCSIILLGIPGLFLGLFLLVDVYFDLFGFETSDKLPRLNHWTKKKLF
jgi:hypothetical protein